MKPKKKDKRIKMDWDVATDLQFLEIHEATVEDAGEYSMEATTDGGTVASSAKVTVIKPQAPKLEDGLKDLTIIEGETLKLTCKITGRIMAKLCSNM